MSVLSSKETEPLALPSGLRPPLVAVAMAGKGALMSSSGRTRLGSAPFRDLSKNGSAFNSLGLTTKVETMHHM